MLFLLLSIICATGIYVLFRISGKYGVSPLSMVIINYITAIIIGIVLIAYSDTIINFKASAGFYVISIVTGVVFVLMFLFMQYAVNIIGVSITSSATKFSVVFPVLLSVIIDPNDSLTDNKIIGVILMVISILLIIHKKTNWKLKNRNFTLPILLFVSAGIVDSIVKLAQQFFIPDNMLLFFTIFVFCISSLTGLLILIVKGEINQLFIARNIWMGVLLGIVNFGGLFFLIKTLNLNLTEKVFFDSSRLFIFNNIGIIVFSVFIGIFAFKERLTIINFIGIGLSLLGFFFLKVTN